LEVLSEYLKRTKELKEEKESELAEQESRLEGQKLLLERSSSQLFILREKEKEFDKQKREALQRLRDEVAEIKSELKEHQDRLGFVEDLSPEIETLRQRLLNFNEEELSSTYEELVTSRAEYAQMVKASREKISQLQLQLQRLNTLKNEERCPYCGQDLTEEGLARFAKELKDEQKAEEIKLCNAERQVNFFSNEITKLQDQMRQLKRLKQRLEQLKERQRSQEMEKAIIENEIKRLKESLREKEEEIKAKERETSPYKSLIEKELSNRKRLQDNITRLEKEIAKSRENLEYLKFWEIGFGNQGLKSFILDSIINFLNKEANYYSRKLSDGDIQINFHTQERLKSGKVRERFGVDVKLRNGASLYSGTSGGERRRVNLAILLALRKLVVSRTSKRFNLLICDEIFDALDDPGIDRAMEILKEEARNGAKVFLVTHSPRFIEADVFDEILIVEKRNGISTIHQRR